MFGKLLEEFVIRKYDKKARFAEECNISTGHLSDIMKGRILPREDTLYLMVEKLSLNLEDKEKFLKEWSFDKTGNILRDKYEKLEKENSEMLKVLKSMENEKTLMKKINEMKNYEEFYESVFKGLTTEEAQEVLTAISDKLKLIALKKGKLDKLDKDFENLDNIIKKIN